MKTATKKTAKPWVAYGGLIRDSIGRVDEVHENGDVTIVYSEGQMYDPELWDKSCTRRFSTAKEAVDYVAELTGDRYHTVKHFRSYFPKEEVS